MYGKSIYNFSTDYERLADLCEKGYDPIGICYPYYESPDFTNSVMCTYDGWDYCIVFRHCDEYNRSVPTPKRHIFIQQLASYNVKFIDMEIPNEEVIIQTE